MASQFTGSSQDLPGILGWTSYSHRHGRPRERERAGICWDLFPEWDESHSPTSSQTKSMSTRETASRWTTETRKLFQIKVLHAEVLMAHSTYRRSGNTHRKIQRHSSLKSKDAKRKQQELNFDPHDLKRKWKNKVSFLVRPKTQSARSALVTTFK